jgi:hypothetical protein
LAIALVVSTAAGATPEIDSISPAVAPPDQPVEVTLRGAGFDPGIDVKLEDGGPFVISRSPLSSARAVATDGRYVYVSDPFEVGVVVVYDAIYPDRPQLLDSVPVGTVIDLFLQDGLLYAVGGGGLSVIDASDPPHLRLLGREDTPGSAAKIVARGDYAYVADGNRGLGVIDVSDPARPRFVTSVYVGGSVYSIAIEGDRLYLAGGERTVVATIEDPARPVVAGWVRTSIGVRDLAVAEGLAVAVGTRSGSSLDGLCGVFDVQDPSSPVQIGEYDLPGAGADVAMAGRTAFVADVDSGLVVLDLSRPERPVATARVPLTFSSGTALATGLAFVADSNDGLVVVDVSTTAAPRRTATLPTPGSAREFDVVGTVAYVADRSGGIRIVDISDPSGPLEIGVLPLSDAADVRVEGDRAYVAHGFGALLSIYDVSEPRAPQFLGRYDAGGAGGFVTSTRAVEVAGEVAYLSVNRHGFSLPNHAFVDIVDVSDPAQPTRLGWTGRWQKVTIFDTALVGDQLFIAGSNFVFGRGFLLHLDASTPTAPFVAAIEPTLSTWPARGVAVADGVAYVTGLRELRTFRADGSALVPLATRSLADSAHGVWVSGDLALVATEDAGATFFDVLDPANPTETGTLLTPGPATRARLRDQTVIVVDGDFEIARLSPPLQDVSSPLDDTVRFTVPVGYPAGPYHVVATNPDGARTVEPNGFRLCGVEDTRVTLEPRSSAEQTGTSRGALRWRVVAVDAPAAKEAVLRLPDLPGNLTVEFVESPARALELHLAPESDQGVVRLFGTDREEMEALWQAIVAAGGVWLPRLDSKSFGDVGLELFDEGGAIAPLSGTMGQAGLQLFAPYRYRYELDGKLLESARAVGESVDLLVVVDATDGAGCPIEGQASLTATLRSVCAELLASMEELAASCPW